MVVSGGFIRLTNIARRTGTITLGRIGIHHGSIFIRAKAKDISHLRGREFGYSVTLAVGGGVSFGRSERTTAVGFLVCEGESASLNWTITWAW
jgi:hypothetical protein